jgi:hypothetical protein
MMKTLILNRDELSTVVEILAKARESGLNGPTSSALSKLRAQLALRFGDVQTKPIFTMANLDNEPSGENEIMVEEVYEVHVICCLDGPFRCPEKVEVNFYGQGGEEICKVPLVSLTLDGDLLAPQGLVHAVLPVPVERVLALFDTEILENFSKRQIPLKWNPGCESAELIDLAKVDPDTILNWETR